MTLWKVSVLCGLVLLCSCFVNGKYNATDVENFGKLCNATQEDIAVALNYNIPSTETGKCFMKCIAGLVDMISSENKFVKSKLQAVLTTYFSETPIDTILKIIEICYNETASITSPTELASCDYYYKSFLCFNIQYKLNGMLPVV
ncbi:Hypothetical protein CINCED_3A007930 [Cinara cedri]|uniref:Pheromone/general odorant binding protein n=1 Tax=Cinara cedri TaxID=506608 RepID=A0A5E4N298_9HEMI|nr:Hypothetical protein CINCED_3A007930 [Cinara cedri]